MDDSPCPFCRKLVAPAQLSADELVWEFPHSVAVLAPWQYYHGYCILISRRHATELSQLKDDERRGYLDEMCRLAHAIERCFQPHKLNYELLGNQVPHLHWHLIPRYLHDPDKPHPIWAALDRAKGNQIDRHRLQTGPQSRARTIALLRQVLQ